MLDIGSSDPLPLEPGDTVAIVTDIRRGDLVCFERVTATQVHLRALTGDEAASHDGPLYRIDRGAEPGTVMLKRHVPG